jgi:hypothetical protein
MNYRTKSPYHTQRIELVEDLVFHEIDRLVFLKILDAVAWTVDDLGKNMK